MKRYPALLLAAAAAATTETAGTAATKSTKGADAAKGKGKGGKSPEEKEAAARKALGDTFVFVKDLDPQKRIAPQAQVIFNTIKAAGKKGITRGDLIKSCTGVIQTRQPVDRIITYYTPTLTKELGVATLTKAA